MNTDEKIVICSYKPKPGKTKELLELLQDHVPTLRWLGFACGHPRTLMTSENGTVIEIFAWRSEAAARAAHDHPEVQELWGKIGALAEIVPLSDVAETRKPFAHFKPAPNSRQLRPMWFELPADDLGRCAKFYEKVFGWTSNVFDETHYWVLDTGREPAPGIDGGIVKRESPRETVRNTVFVDSVDEFVRKIESAGGSVVVPKTKIDKVGSVAYCKDTEGNVFGLLQPLER
jgi:predicted enzyme related to lactoylglutathione lyase